MVTDSFPVSPKRHSVSPFLSQSKNADLYNAKASQLLKEMRNSSLKFSYDSPVKEAVG